jgi:hypothetical protein
VRLFEDGWVVFDDDASVLACLDILASACPSPRAARELRLLLRDPLRKGGSPEYAYMLGGMMSHRGTSSTSSTRVVIEAQPFVEVVPEGTYAFGVKSDALATASCGDGRVAQVPPSASLAALVQAVQVLKVVAPGPAPPAPAPAPAGGRSADAQARVADASRKLVLLDAAPVHNGELVNAVERCLADSVSVRWLQDLRCVRVICSRCGVSISRLL